MSRTHIAVWKTVNQHRSEWVGCGGRRSLTIQYYPYLTCLVFLGIFICMAWVDSALPPCEARNHCLTSHRSPTIPDVCGVAEQCSKAGRFLFFYWVTLFTLQISCLSTCQLQEGFHPWYNVFLCSYIQWNPSSIFVGSISSEHMILL